MVLWLSSSTGCINSFKWWHTWLLPWRTLLCSYFVLLWWISTYYWMSMLNLPTPFHPGGKFSSFLFLGSCFVLPLCPLSMRSERRKSQGTFVAHIRTSPKIKTNDSASSSIPGSIGSTYVSDAGLCFTRAPTEHERVMTAQRVRVFNKSAQVQRTTVERPTLQVLHKSWRTCQGPNECWSCSLLPPYSRFFWLRTVQLHCETAGWTSTQDRQHVLPMCFYQGNSCHTTCLHLRLYGF